MDSRLRGNDGGMGPRFRGDDGRWVSDVAGMAAALVGADDSRYASRMDLISRTVR